MTSIVKGLRAINAAARGAMTSTQLQTYLGDSVAMASFQRLAQMPAKMTLLASSAAAMAVVAGSALARGVLYTTRPAVDAITSSSVAMTAVAAAASPAVTELFAQPYAATRAAASPPAMAALVASAGAMGQVAASTAGMAAVTATPTGMNALIGSQTAMDAVNAVPAARTAFRTSTVLTPISLPTMASYTASSAGVPNGTWTVTMSNDNTINLAHNLFDKQNDAAGTSGANYWSTSAGNASNQWVAIQAPAPVLIYSAMLEDGLAGGSTTAKDWRIEWSDDGTTWASASATATLPMPAGAATSATVDITKAGRHAYWRVYVLNNYGGTTIRASELTLIGFV